LRLDSSCLAVVVALFLAAPAAAPRAVGVQISAGGLGMVWRVTRMTFTLRARGFVFSRIERRTPAQQQIARRRCPLLRG